MPEPGPCETKAVPGPALGRGLGAGGAGFWWTGGGWGRGLGGGAQRRAPPGGGGGCQRSAGAGGVAGGDRGDRVSPQNHRKRCSAAFRGHRTLHARALLFSSGWATSCPAQRSGSQIPAENAVLAKKKKKAPHGDTTCSRKTFPLFFSWHGLRQLPERIGANSKKPLLPFAFPTPEPRQFILRAQGQPQRAAGNTRGCPLCFDDLPSSVGPTQRVPTQRAQAGIASSGVTRSICGCDEPSRGKRELPPFSLL